MVFRGAVVTMIAILLVLLVWSMDKGLRVARQTPTNETHRSVPPSLAALAERALTCQPHRSIAPGIA